jgi:hypothetical protein
MYAKPATKRLRNLLLLLKIAEEIAAPVSASVLPSIHPTSTTSNLLYTSCCLVAFIIRGMWILQS